MENNEKEHLARTNQFYIAQVNSMEIKITELKAQIHSKDFEIDYLSSKISATQRENYNFRDLHETELKLRIAEQENEYLKKKIEEFKEIEIVKSQLEQAIHIKNLFEQKYRELKTQLLIDDKSFDLISEKEEEISCLKQEIEIIQKVNEENNEKIRDLVSEINELKHILQIKNSEIQALKGNKTGFKGIFKLDLNRDVDRNCYQGSPNTAKRPGSTINHRKESPDIRSVKVSNLRSNLQYQSGKATNSEYQPRPKIINISLESTIKDATA